MDPKRLHSVPLFQNLSKKEIEQLSRNMDEVDLPEGKYLAQEGTFAYEFFVIEEGTASVSREGKKIRDLGPGDFFGEIGVLEANRRTATVISTSPMVAIVIAGHNFRTIEREHPEIATKIREAIEQRLEADRKS